MINRQVYILLDHIVYKRHWIGEIMARKTLSAEDKMGIVVNFRVKLDEYKKLEELAERTGESVGQFVRSSVLNRYNF